jgi:Fe(II)/alpha-ketoglutarate-dependent arginine beta-hydroxylase
MLTIPSYDATAAEADVIRHLADDLIAEVGEDDDALVLAAKVSAAELPTALRAFFAQVIEAESTDVILVRRGAADDRSLGPTPSEWSTGATTPAAPAARREEVVLMLLASLVGDVFGWETQQSGRIVHDIIPIRGMQLSLTSAGSTASLPMHTEDSFHPARADYVGLGCLRNDRHVRTTVSRPAFGQLTEEELSILTAPRFALQVDDPHTRQDDETTYAAVLSGPYDDLSMCVDTDCTIVAAGDRAAEHALARLCHLIAEATQAIVLEPGDICFLNNHRVVHGRSAFEARFDGTDRWLKRVNITRHLRKSRPFRARSDSRVVT